MAVHPNAQHLHGNGAITADEGILLFQLAIDGSNPASVKQKLIGKRAVHGSQQLGVHKVPVIDNYERSLTVEPESEEGKNILKGNKMILNQLMNILGKNGVTVIEAQGKEFDPNMHQAVMQDDNPDFGPNIVTEELQKGYMLKDRVIRATLVKVNKD